MKTLLFILMIISSSVMAKDTTNTKVFVSPQEKRFCMSFIPGYLASMQTNKPETLTFTGIRSKSSYQIQFKNNLMIMFLLTQASIESGWASSMAIKNNNYWGLGGNYPRPDGTNTFMSFNDFHQGHSYLINHLAYGLTRDGANHKYHPGWPEFIKLVESDRTDISTDEINRSLNSGPYCKKYPAYNTDLARNCAAKNKKNCPCVDYSKTILEVALPRLVSKCIATYETYFEKNQKQKLFSLIQIRGLSQEQMREQIEQAHEFLQQYIGEE